MSLHTRTNFVTATRLPLTPKRKRSVKFSYVVAGRNLLHINDFSDAELEACWYAHADFRVFKKEILEIAKMIDQGLQVECARGIEFYTVEGKTQRRNCRLDASIALFLEQERQDEKGCFDEEKLALSYREYTESCQSKAHTIGIADSHAVKTNHDVKAKHYQRFFGVSKNTKPFLRFSGGYAPAG